MSKSVEELLAEIERSEERATYAVLADALVERGEPRGELMQIQLALDGARVEDPPPWPRAFSSRAAYDLEREDRDPTLDRAAADELRKKANALIEARTDALLAELPKHHGVKVEFRYGLLDKLTVSFSTLPPAELGTAIARVLASPEARMLRMLQLDPPSRRTQGWFQQLFADLGARDLAVPSSLRTVVCGDLYPGDDYQFSGGENSTDDLSGVLAVFPKLEELWVRVGALDLTWPTLASSSLRHLTFVTPSIHADDLNAFASAELPALASFVIWTGAAHYVNDKADMSSATPGRSIALAQLEPVFAMLDRCPELRTLGIANHVNDVAELVTAIAAHPVGQRIQTLDLSFANAVDGTTLGPSLDRLPALREVVIEGVDVTNQGRITSSGRTLAGGFTYGLSRFRYVVHQE